MLDAVAYLRNRKVELFLLPGLPPHVTGIAVQGKDTDHIGISDRLSLRHQAHVLLHEVRHLFPADAGELSPADVTGPAAIESTASTVAVHSHFDGVTLQDLENQMAVLPARVRDDLLTRPAKLRASYKHDEEHTCEVFARVVLLLLDLDTTSKSTGSLAAALSNSRFL
ncbi:hypothetical protein QQY66_18460 [Streptomyces sp. DG2A-72]|uniref:hypothetical protein n=1 Tax=Streptomyces sp. DG2A-72 TaxID=3051386 RepID=UPI00265C2D4D|nr:hypothetical protein [Streptomyces sp. DG2A-72]MDO0933567.1 hypothetical protein [Streptomyces sp. DG2A-72]